MATPSFIHPIKIKVNSFTMLPFLQDTDTTDTTVLQDTKVSLVHIMH